MIDSSARDNAEYKKYNGYLAFLPSPVFDEKSRFNFTNIIVQAYKK